MKIPILVYLLVLTYNIIMLYADLIFLPVIKLMKGGSYYVENSKRNRWKN